MKCISRSTLGVVVGVFDVVAYLLVSIVCIIKLEEFSKARYKYDTRSYDRYHTESRYDNNDTGRDISPAMLATFLTICLIMIPFSALLIVGIVKKRYSFLAPWIYFSVIGFVVTSIRSVFLIIIIISSRNNSGIIVRVFVALYLLLGLQAVIIYTIYTLYRDLLNKRNELPGQTITAGNVGVTDVHPEQMPYYTSMLVKS